MKKVKLFYSYAQQDEAFKIELDQHLAILKRRELIESWEEHAIPTDDDWGEDLSLELDESQIILLLISAYFLASDYCYETETIRALEKHENQEAIVIPVILRPCLWQMSDFGNLVPLPTQGKPITTWENKDEGWLDVAKGVFDIVDDAQKLKIPEDYKQPIPELLTIHQKDKPLSWERMELSDDLKHLDKDKRRTRNTTPKEYFVKHFQQGAEIDELEVLLVQFLARWYKWYFSPLRIQKWGAKQGGFPALGEYSTQAIRQKLEALLKQEKVTEKTSKKGNRIYKIASIR